MCNREELLLDIQLLFLLHLHKAPQYLFPPKDLWVLGLSPLLWISPLL